jgi:glycerol dehydrogenase
MLRRNGGTRKPVGCCGKGKVGLKFYTKIGLLQKLSDLGLGNITLSELKTAAEIVASPNSDIHRLPFKVAP